MFNILDPRIIKASLPRRKPMPVEYTVEVWVEAESQWVPVSRHQTFTHATQRAARGRGHKCRINRLGGGTPVYGWNWKLN